MPRQTSVDCYNQIKAQGLLSKMRLKVYEAIFNNAPCTSGEAFATMVVEQGRISQSRARFTELRELGVIYEKGIRRCKISGRNVIEWDLTDNLPQGVVNNKTYKPNNLKKCISYIINKMESDGIMFAEKEYLKSLKEK